jgi:hypothetical protein
MAFTDREQFLLGIAVVEELRKTGGHEWVGRLIVDAAFARSEAKRLLGERSAGTQDEIDQNPSKLSGLTNYRDELDTLRGKL